MTRPRPEPPCRTLPRKGWNRLSRALCGKPGPVSRTRISLWPVISDAVTVTVPGWAPGLDCLGRVADEVGEHPEQLISIGPHGQALGNLRREAHAIGCGCALVLQHLRHQRRERHHHRLGRQFLRLAEGERALAQADRARQRPHELGRRAPHRRIRTRLDAVRQELGRGQDVAQVVADLGHRRSQSCQPFLLPKRRRQLHLEVVQRRLRFAKLARAALRGDRPARVHRVVAIGGHVLHHPPDRPHDQPLHRQKQQRRSRQRYRERNEQDPPAVFDHRLPKRPFVQRHLDLALRALVGAADDPDDPVLVGNEDPERIAHQRHLVVASQVECLRDRGRHRPGQRQLAHVVPPQHHVQHVRRGEELGLQVRRNRHVGRGQQGERRELPHFQAVLQIVHAEPRYRRDEDQHLGDHHEEDRQAQKAPGKGIEDHADHGSRRRRTVGGAPFPYKAPSPGRSCPQNLPPMLAETGCA